MGVSRIRLTIDRLSIPAFESGDRRALVEGLRAELSRMLADPAARAQWSRSQRRPVLRLGQMPIEAGPAGGRRFGARIAAGIGKGLKP